MSQFSWTPMRMLSALLTSPLRLARRLNLAFKLSLALYVSLIPLFLAALWVGLNAKESLEQTTEDLVKARQVKELASTSLVLLMTQEVVTQSILLDPDNIVEAPRKIQAYDDAVATFARMKTLSRSREILELIDQLTVMDEKELRPLDTAILEAVGEGKGEQAKKLYFGQYFPKRLLYENQVRKLGQVADKAAEAAVDEMTLCVKNALVNMALSLLCGAGLAGVAVLLITRRIGSRLKHTVRVMAAVASGDLTQRLQVTSRDEVGQMAEALNQAIEAMSKAVRADKVNWEIVAAQKEREQELIRIMSMIEGAPLNILYTERNLQLKYANRASLHTLASLQRYLPVRAEGLVGQQLEVIHEELRRNRHRLSDPSCLPTQLQVCLGPETLSFTFDSIQDQQHNVLGIMVTWEVITEKLAHTEEMNKLRDREQRQVEELKDKVDNILEVVSAAAEGDLTYEVTVCGSDAIGRLGEGLNHFFADLRDSIGCIAVNSQGLTAASEELATVSQQMNTNASRASEQSDAAATAARRVSQNVQTVAAAVEQMSAGMHEIAKSASSAAQATGSAVQVVKATNATVTRLGESGTEIGKVINVINTIAEQTKLLALNATIEAARAGEAGKGFAVVASEVKELAKATAEATHSISQKIYTIQTNTTEAIEAITQISSIIGEVNSISTNIASAVEEQTSTTSSITRSVSEAATACAQIVNNISDVAQTSQSASEGANTTQLAASRLTDMASKLQQLVNRFHYTASEEHTYDRQLVHS